MPGRFSSLDTKNATHAELIRILVMDTALDSRIQPREVWSPDEHESYRGMDTIELFAYGDYTGSDLDVANHREFVNVFGDIFYTETERATDYVAVYLCNDRRMPLFDLSRLDDQARADFDELETLRSIVAVMIGLQENYPLMSDETHSEYVDELAEAAWAQYMESDISRAVEEYMAARGSEGENGQQDWEWSEQTIAAQEAFREAFYAYPDHEWTCETATSVACRTEQAGIVHACYVVWEAGHCSCERCDDKRGPGAAVSALLPCTGVTVIGHCPCCHKPVMSDDPDGPVWTCPTDLNPNNPHFVDDPISEADKVASGVYGNCREDITGACSYDAMPLHSACYGGDVPY